MQLEKSASTDDPSQGNGGECIKGCMCALGCIGSSLVGDRNIERKHLGGVIIKLTETVCALFLGIEQCVFGVQPIQRSLEPRPWQSDLGTLFTLIRASLGAGDAIHGGSPDGPGRFCLLVARDDFKLPRNDCEQT